MSGFNAIVLQWFITGALLLGLWFVVSIFAAIVRRTLSSLGMDGFAGRIASLAQKFGAFGKALENLPERLRVSTGSAEGASVMLALDERHKHLRGTLKKTEQTVRNTVSAVAGLEGAQAPNALAAEIKALSIRTHGVSKVAVEFDENIVEAYAAHADSKMTLFLSLLGSAIIIVANGILLSQFFKDLIPIRINGIPIAYGAAVLFVALEYLCGLLFVGAFNSPTPSRRVVSLIILSVGSCCLIFMEFIAFAMVSMNFDTENYINSFVPSWWMGIFGLGLVLVNTYCGYASHMEMTKLAKFSGATRLHNELKAARKFVDDLPQVWSNVDARARAAEGSVQRYADALGGQSDRMKGALDHIFQQKNELIESLHRVSFDDKMISGKEGDAALGWGRALGLFFVALILLIGFVSGFSFLLSQGFNLPVWTAAGLAAVLACGFIGAGRIAYDQIQVLDGHRLHPISPAPIILAGAAFFGIGALIGICWVCVASYGLWGVLLGVLVTALCIPFTWLGQQIDAVGRGGVIVVRLAWTVSIALVGATLALLRYLLLWAAAVIVFTLKAVLSIISAPVELALKALSRKPPLPPTNLPSQA